MSVCNRAWVERYVTSTRNVSIQNSHHQCDREEGHASEDRSRAIPTCQCRCGAQPPVLRRGA